MLRAVFLALLVLLLPTCCATNQPPAHYLPYDSPGASIFFVGDVDFSPAERLWVQEAADNLAAQTRGFIRVQVIYDLDFRSIESLQDNYGLDLLIKVDTTAGPVREFDSEHCCLLGLTHVAHDQLNELMSWTDVFLVTDRIAQFGPDHKDTHTLFVSVAMHELLHALGVPHVPNPHALMAPSAEADSPTALQPDDYRALCKVWACNVRRMTNGRVSD